MIRLPPEAGADLRSSPRTGVKSAAKYARNGPATACGGRITRRRCGERAIVENVALELNRTLAADRKIRLEVARWETDAYPRFHLDGPQGICHKHAREIT